MRYLLLTIIFFLPSRLKIVFYRMLGAKIGKGCHIGFSFLSVKNIHIDDYVYIGNFNLLWRLQSLRMRSGSRITMLNWITGANKGSFEIGKNSSISAFHFLEASANIIIGSNTIIAGRSSQFFTHGITPSNLDDMRQITIGDWCYVGSAVRFVPGSSIADHTFVGMGSVVTKQYNDNYVLLAGVPAKIKKRLPQVSLFFNRSYLPHAHHSSSYNGAL